MGPPGNTLERAGAATVAIALALATTVTAGDLFRRGDVNSDGVLDISDAVAIFGFLFLGADTPACLDAADANDDGSNDLSDGVAILNFLFQGGPQPPTPRFDAACPGRDPTADALDCAGGSGAPRSPPGIDFAPVTAPPPRVRERSRWLLEETGPGVFRVEEGTSFALLVEAQSNEDTLAPLSLVEPDDPRDGNPDTLDVRCDRNLGDPSAGGVAAGDSLAPFFFRDIDAWEDPVYLITQASMRIAGDGPLAPAPGSYRFTASVVDARCARSETASFTLVVEPSSAPEVQVWTEDAAGAVRPHDPGTGNARVTAGEPVTLVVEGLPNGRGGAAPDPSSLSVIADPAFPAGADLTPRFGPGDRPARLEMTLDGEWFPCPGNTDLLVSMRAGDAERTVRFRLETPLGFAADIAPIFRVSCTGCHEEPGPDKGLVLVDPSLDRIYRNIVNVFASEPAITSIAPLLVWPYFPERSYLVHKIRGTFLDPDVAGEGRRMPADEGFLDETTEKLIIDWVAQGAPR